MIASIVGWAFVAIFCLFALFAAAVKWRTILSIAVCLIVAINIAIPLGASEGVMLLASGAAFWLGWVIGQEWEQWALSRMYE